MESGAVPPKKKTHLVKCVILVTTAKMVFSSSALVLAAIAIASASNVVDLVPDTFDDIVNGERAVFVEFYAP